jgi:hypothetical protein
LHRHTVRIEPFAMKTIIKTIWCILVLAVSAAAANYTVKSDGGGNYTTIQACATAMSAGDTCTVYAGTYNENVTVSAGGVGSYKTLTVNPGDTVTMQGFTINSHVKVNGFHIQDPSSPNTTCVSASSATDFYITNNVMISCGGINGTGNHGFIQGNTLSYMGTTPGGNNTGPAISIHGDYLLMENNDISHVSDGLHFGGSHFVFRHNTMHDTLASECGANSGNCHIDFIEDEPNIPSSFNVYESNTEINNLGGNGHGFLLQADVCSGQCSNVIIRFNTLEHVGSAGVENDNQYLKVKTYNNTYADVSGSGGNGFITNYIAKSALNASDLNDLFYFPFSVNGSNAIATDGTTSGSFIGGHNLAWCTGTCSIHGYAYGSGNWTDDPTNLLADPQFVNYAGNDFDLNPGSPAIGAGTYLTTVAAADSGSGTSLVVNDANFFQDGSGITGVNADCISVTTVTNHVCITAVNYSTNTLTLASSITRSAGNPVWLYSDSTGRTVLIGSAPNIGATFDPAQAPAPAPAPPTNLRAVIH